MQNQSRMVRLSIVFSSVLALVAAFGRELFSKNKALFSLSNGDMAHVDYQRIYLKLISQTDVSYENSRNEEQIEQDKLRVIAASFAKKRIFEELSSSENSVYALSFAEQSGYMTDFNFDKQITLISLIKKRNLNLVKAYCAEHNDDWDFFARDGKGNTPLHLCVLLDCPEIFDLIRDRFKDFMTSKNTKGDTLLHLAIQQGNMGLFNKILDPEKARHYKNQLLLTPNALGLLPLSLSAAMGYFNMVRALLNLYSEFSMDLKPYVEEALQFATTAYSLKNVSSEAVVATNQTFSFALGRDETRNRLFVPKQQHPKVIGLLELTLNPRNQSLDDESTRVQVKRKLF